jgi:hypothetical protein
VLLSFPCGITSAAASSAPNPCSWYFVFRLRRLVLWECDWANPWFRLPYRDGGWLLVRVARLHYLSGCSQLFILADFQLVILFKILRREDRDNIRIICNNKLSHTYLRFVYGTSKPPSSVLDPLRTRFYDCTFIWKSSFKHSILLWSPKPRYSLHQIYSLIKILLSDYTDDYQYVWH